MLMMNAARAYFICLLITSNAIAAERDFSTLTQPTLTSPVLAPTVPTTPTYTEPAITAVSSSNCVDSGDTITILGTNFGSKSSVALGGLGSFINLMPTYWSNNKIIATLPQDSRIKAGEQFYVTMKTTSSRTWLTNSNQYVHICKANLPDTLAPDTGPPQQTSTHPETPTAEEVTDTPAVEEVTENTPYQNVLPTGGGSLMGRGLPPVPENLASASQTKIDESKIEPNELIVISNDMAQARELAQQLGQYGLRTKKRKNLKSLGLVISTFQTNTAIDLQQTAINIRSVYPNMWADVNHRYTLLSNNRNTGVAKDIIKWNNTNSSCGKGIRLGLIDTEINKSHPALLEQNIVSHSIITHGIKKANSDHGTAIATLLVGSNESESFSGLLPSATLYSASVFRVRGENTVDTTSEWIVSAIDWLLSQDVQVINMSIGGPRNLLVSVAIQRTIESGVPVIAAVGNGGADAVAVFPAAQDGVIAVTAIDSEMNLYSKANHGGYIDFSAPGVDIWAGNEKGSGKFFTGTSFSVPFVTASVASVINKLDSDAAYSYIQESVKDLGDTGKDNEFGWGLVQTSNLCH